MTPHPDPSDLNRLMRCARPLTALMALMFALLLMWGIPSVQAQETKVTPLQGLYALEMDLPGTHVLKGIEGVNFMVNYIARGKPRADGKFAALGVYVGFSPNRFCKLDEKGEKKEEGQPVTIGPWKTMWHDCPSAKTKGSFHRETHIAPGDGELRLHVFISGNDKEEMAVLEKMVKSLRPVENQIINETKKKS